MNEIIKASKILHFACLRFEEQINENFIYFDYVIDAPFKFLDFQSFEIEFGQYRIQNVNQLISIIKEYKILEKSEHVARLGDELIERNDNFIKREALRGTIDDEFNIWYKRTDIEKFDIKPGDLWFNNFAISDYALKINLLCLKLFPDEYSKHLYCWYKQNGRTPFSGLHLKGGYSHYNIAKAKLEWNERVKNYKLLLKSAGNDQKELIIHAIGHLKRFLESQTVYEIQEYFKDLILDFEALKDTDQLKGFKTEYDEIQLKCLFDKLVEGKFIKTSDKNFIAMFSGENCTPVEWIGSRKDCFSFFMDMWGEEIKAETINKYVHQSKYDPKTNKPNTKPLKPGDRTNCKRGFIEKLL